MKNKEIDLLTETTDLVQIFKQFGIYRTNLSPENDKFVKEQLQKEYDTISKTYVLGGKAYMGAYREDSKRKFNKDAYEKESKLATVLASFGFDVILIEEDNSKPGKKPDAIVNGIVMDFKEINAINEEYASTNTLGNNYQNGINKNHSKGVAMYLHNFTNEFVSETMTWEKTSSKENANGLALFFHEDTGALQLLDMQKIRASHFEKPFCMTPGENTEPQQSNDISQLVKKSTHKKRKDSGWEW